MSYLMFAPLFGLFLMSHDVQAVCPSCHTSQNLTQVRIPAVMTFDDFQKHVIGVEWAELYFAYSKKGIFDPYYNYKINYTMDSSGAVKEQVVADELGLNFDVTPKCIRATAFLKLTPKQGETDPMARFQKKGTQMMQYFWSSCPDQYLWIFKCKSEPRTHCPIDEIELGMAVPYRGMILSLENLPWSSILTDLRRATKIILGTDDLYWAWTFGESIYCNQ